MEARRGRHGALNQSSLRDQNLRVVAQTLWGAGGGLTRAELSARTGLTRATVSRLVSELIGAQLVEEAGPAESGQPGRPGTQLRPAAASVAAVGLEINIDHTAGRVIDLAGTILGEFVTSEDTRGATPGERFEQLGKRAASMVRRVMSSHPGLRLCGVCLAAPGFVSGLSQIRFAPNLGWRDVVPADLMGRAFARLGVDFVVDNDADLQALAVSRLAPGRLVADPTFLFIAGDVGVGSAIVERGQVQRGQHGWAGEMGHMTIDPLGPECACGSRGCLERYAGRWAVQEAAGLETSFDSDRLLELLREHDPDASRAVDQAAWALGIAIANTLNILDMRQVVLGTSLADIAPWTLPKIHRIIAEHLLWADFESVVLLPARPDLLPASTGAAYRVLEQVLDDPARWIAEQVQDG
ncbi:ROK family transcriptional regulator [Brooklawnia cerclae]|uniref:NBD/HSP70 family sugar kinase n=1 Tax=Brooklawnia cerclae TaxID=349934 RepID=A0ABX0SPQ3_9ACTN|nr:putative NBD/HSP70 family sugar kinase [Brooklawnia cerclae]